MHLVVATVTLINQWANGAEAKRHSAKSHASIRFDRFNSDLSQPSPRRRSERHGGQRSADAGRTVQSGSVWV